MKGKEYMSVARGDAAGQAATAKAAAPKTEFKFIGKPTPRVDGREIVTGRARYTPDIKLQGLLIGKILRSPYAAAEVVSIDLAPALALPGVRAALKLAEGKVRYAGQQVASAGTDQGRVQDAPLRRRRRAGPRRGRAAGAGRPAQSRQAQ